MPPAASGPRRLRHAAALALGLGLPLLLLLAGGPAGAAAQAPPGPLPPAALKGKPKPLEACAAVTVSSSEPCQVKKRGQKLVLKEPAVTVSPLDDSGAEYDMNPNQFAKDFKQSYSPGEGPTGELELSTGQFALLQVDGVKYKKQKDKMTFTVDPSDAAALKALDAADACEVEFLTPCDAPPTPPSPPPPPPPPPPVGGTCAYSDTTCAVGDTCPGGTAVSAECVDPAGTTRRGPGGNPCACTALQELAALSSDLQAEAPWNALADNSYCTKGVVGDYDYDYELAIKVVCTVVDGVELPTSIYVGDEGLAGALPPSVGELRSLDTLDLNSNAISSLPTEIGALTNLEILDLFDNDLTSVPTEVGALAGLTFLGLGSNAITSLPTEIGALPLSYLYLNDNDLTGVPSDFRTIDPSSICRLYGNPSFSCANVGAGTKCCTSDNDCGPTLSGGPCYTG